MASETAPMAVSEDDTSFIEATRAEAEAGSADHQLFLGRYYVKQARANKDPEENGMLGIDWLIKASGSGKNEATTLLRGCLADKIGVTEDNIDDIKWCINTSDQAKAIRIAARKLYQELNPSKGDEPCSKADYLQRVKDLTSERSEKKFLISTANKVKSADVIVEEEFVETVTRRMQSGQIDPAEDDVEMAAFNDASISRKLMKYPGTSVTFAVDTVVEFLTTDLVNILMYVLPIDQLNILIGFFLFSLLSFTWLFSIFSLTSYYLSFTVLVICTLQIFKNKRKQSEVKAMAGMLHRYSADVDAKTAETEFVMNSRRPYWTFLASLFIFVPSFCLANKTWIPCSELALVSSVIAVASVVYLSKHDDPIVLTSLGFDLLSCLPHILAGFPEIPLLSQLIWVLTVPLYSIKILPGFFLNLSIPALEYAILPLLFIRMAYKDKWQGVYKVLMPHLVGFFWLQIVVLYFEHSTWLGLARGSMGWISFIFLFPFVTVAGSVYGIYYSFVTFNYMSILRVVVTVLLLLTPVLLSIWQGYGYSMGGLSLRGRSLKLKMAVILVPLGLAAVGMLVLSGGGDDSDSPPLMPWELYRDRCSQPAWEKTNMADTQRACEHFRFMEVNWTGIVESVNITEIENPADSFLDNFADEIAESLKCLYGKKYDPCDVETMSDLDFQLCKLRVAYGRSCHMKDKRSYTFLLTVAMPLGKEDLTKSLPIVATDEFRDIVFQLKKGHVVEFNAVLQKLLGSDSPVIKLEGIKCKTCMMSLTEAHSSTVDPMKQVRNAILESVSFFTSPLLEYHHPAPKKRATQLPVEGISPEVPEEDNASDMETTPEADTLPAPDDNIPEPDTLPAADNIPEPDTLPAPDTVPEDLEAVPTEYTDDEAEPEHEEL